MRRVMCVLLPNWPLQRLYHERPGFRDKPIVLVSPNGVRGQHVVLCSAEAARSGVRAGMPLAEALAINPQLLVEEENLEGDVRSLQRLAQWAERFSPIVGLEENPRPECLFLDITGCAACFPSPLPLSQRDKGEGNGENRLLQRAAYDLAQQGWVARIAIADTIGAAWALARGEKRETRGEGERRGRRARAEQISQHFLLSPLAPLLSSLPVAALRLPADILDLLAELGIEQIAQINSLPRSSLVSRFGPILLQRLDQALGRLPETITPCGFVSAVQAVHYFDPPTDHRGLLYHVLAELIERVAKDLQNRCWAARKLRCQLHHETASPLRIEINLYRPVQSAQHLWMLLRTQLEQVQAVEPICAVGLHVAGAERARDEQPELFPGVRDQGTGGSKRGSCSLIPDPCPLPPEIAILIDRLSARLGQGAVTGVSLLADAQPEYACRYEPLVQGMEGQKDRGTEGRRDSWLFSAPLRETKNLAQRCKEAEFRRYLSVSPSP